MKSIVKITMMSLVLTAPMISEAAPGKTPAQRLADSLLCNNVKIVQQGDLGRAQQKMMQGLVLSETKLPSSDKYFYYTVIKLKEPLVYPQGLQSNTLSAQYSNTRNPQLLELKVLFKEPAQKIGKKLPGKFVKNGSQYYKDVGKEGGSMLWPIEDSEDIITKEKEYKSFLRCIVD
ncbi:hypothetical protein PT286_02085 [Neisseriaceae bacterium ESL0693]|nr:hypothetical protein [Neisseriaceae bacterium ESL0693]